MRSVKAAWVCVLLGVAVQGSFMFNGGSFWQITASVLLLTAASVLLLWRNVGARAAVLAAAGVVLVTFLAEAIGVATNFPFGEYAYSGGLGWSLFGVSLIVPFAWLMMAYPAWEIANRIITWGGKKGVAAKVVLASWAMVAWDVFLDTQMVAAGNWSWQNPEPSLIGTPGIPLTNYLGWFVVSTLIMLIFAWCFKEVKKNKTATGQYPLYAIYLWTWLGSVVANLTFWQRPGLALVGGIAMGTVAVWLLIVLRRRPA